MLIDFKCANGGCLSSNLKEADDPYDMTTTGKVSYRHMRYLRCEDCGQLHEYPIMQPTSRGSSLHILRNVEINKMER